MATRKWFKWTVEFQVAACWVEDGFELTNERALDMISSDLRSANIGMELKAKVLSAPNPEAVAKIQGYKSAEDKRRRESAPAIPQEQGVPDGRKTTKKEAIA